MDVSGIVSSQPKHFEVASQNSSSGSGSTQINGGQGHTAHKEEIRNSGGHVTNNLGKEGLVSCLAHTVPFFVRDGRPTRSLWALILTVIIMAVIASVAIPIISRNAELASAKDAVEFVQSHKDSTV
ncbi:hypothetical protein PG984_010734 [Apiospora sp. TS-2023a]